MIETDMDTDFTNAVRAELIAVGGPTSQLHRLQRRRRALTAAASALALIAVTTGAAVAIAYPPGTITVEPSGKTVLVSHTGTASVDLGPVPEDADVVVVELTCLSDTGIVSFATVRAADGSEQGAGIQCAVNRGGTLRFDNVLLPPAGTTAITITAPATTTWRISARYGTAAVEPWGVNANGQTFGISNARGIPDLEVSKADNGTWGYTSTMEIGQMDRTGYINVYQSDGTTVVGRQQFQIIENIPLDPELIPTDD